MPQGKMKVKVNRPKSLKKNSVGGRGTTTRKNKPMFRKIDPLSKVQMLNRKITKNVNAALEDEIREMASQGQTVTLSSKKNESNANKKNAKK